MIDTTTNLASLTNDQVLILFEKIASSINLMAEICRSKAAEYGVVDGNSQDG